MDWMICYRLAECFVIVLIFRAIDWLMELIHLLNDWLSDWLYFNVIPCRLIDWFVCLFVCLFVSCLPDAWELIFESLMRKQGVPARDQNGKNFLYEIRIMDSTMSEPRFLTTTNFANYVIPAPSDRATTVIITPRNFKGPGVSETVTIPAVVDHPRKINFWFLPCFFALFKSHFEIFQITDNGSFLFTAALLTGFLFPHGFLVRIRFANVVKFDSTTYEINWATNRPARFIDLFWCPTSLSTHLAKVK